MLDNEVAETLMSLSAPDEHKFSSPLYAKDGLPWHQNKKRSFRSFNLSPSGGIASSLPTSSFMHHYASSGQYIHGSLPSMPPLTSMIPDKRMRDNHDDDDDDDDDDDSDVEMTNDSDDSDDRDAWRSHRSPFDGLVAAAHDQAVRAGQGDTDGFLAPASRPISIPSKRGMGGRSGLDHGLPTPPRRTDHGKIHKWSLSRVKQDASYIGRDCSPTGVEEDRAWFDSFQQTDEYRQRARLASVCSSEGSDYGGLGRKHLEEFIRMEISAANENEAPNHPMDMHVQHDGEVKYIGSYSPEARRKRIDRFLEKRKRRVWSKKVDYDVRKNFANSRLRVKGRFVKKEDEELLCELMSMT